MLPVSRVHVWWWIPLVLDLYSLPMIVLLIVHRFRTAKKDDPRPPYR